MSNNKMNIANLFVRHLWHLRKRKEDNVSHCLQDEVWWYRRCVHEHIMKQVHYH